ncbi:uncharacterized protein LOC111697704 [Eurytemora carolleeae]|uniref:uncharacterized protein LOC111697704 n=1 Tax=Eurytemora carolleeae TaxID=1294199 RepID=UPI000C76DCAD|nr:uncharacterized protein LOC111697704 [Eurytemora carolleeae]XP_023323563.1 uncharacterized protein LOC111697704 [Eurytemora carolleeae]|eukprot:XP_023323562.1 uncharacterized protein LOC111697704 [Eurytemora affinis]
MKTIKHTVSSLFSSSRRSSSGSDKDDEVKQNGKNGTGKGKGDRSCIPKINYQRRFSVPNAEDTESKSSSPVVEQYQYPIYQWPSFRKQKSQRRHSVAVSAGGQMDLLHPSRTRQRRSPLGQLEEEERRPSLADLQAEDRERRPSLIMYQSEDTEHPDVVALQKLVDRLHFSEQT